MQMLAADPAPQPGGVRNEVNILQPDTSQLAAAVTGPPQRQHDEPVPGIAARPQQRQYLAVAGRIHHPLRLRQPVPRAAAEPHPGVFAADLGRKVVVLDEIEQRVQRHLAHRPACDGVLEELADGGQHGVHPAGTPHDAGLRSGSCVRVVALQPVNEPAELTRRLPPVPADRRTPLEEQRQRPGIGLGRALRAVPAQANVQQPLIRPGHRPVPGAEHRPVPFTRRQPDPERPEPPHPPPTSVGD